MLRSFALALLSLGFLVLPVESRAHSQPQQKSQQKTKGLNKAQREAAKRAEDAAKRAKLLDRYYGICDLDDSGWISFREASATMGITKSEFRILDNDSDGRFERSEFGKHSAQVLDLLGAFPDALPEETKLAPKTTVKPKVVRAPLDTAGSSRNPFADALAAGSEGNLDFKELLASTPAIEAPTHEPAAPSAAPAKTRLPRIPYPSPKEMLILFDRDKSGGLSRREIKGVLERVGAKLSSDVIVDRTDRNENGELESMELGPLSFIISRRLPADGFLSLKLPGASGTDQMDWETKGSGLAKPLNGLLNAEQFSHFKRLDTNGNGKIESADLRTKLTQSHSSVRASAIISALDSDGDGSIGPEEFTVALRGRN